MKAALHIQYQCLLGEGKLRQPYKLWNVGTLNKTAFLFYVYECFPTCVYVCYKCALYPAGPEEGMDPLELEIFA